VKCNVEIVALVKARKTAMRRIGERYRLDVSTIYTRSRQTSTGFILGPQIRKSRGSRAINRGML